MHGRRVGARLGRGRRGCVSHVTVNGPKAAAPPAAFHDERAVQRRADAHIGLCADDDESPDSKLRGKNLIGKPGRTRRYQVAPSAARTVAALLALRNQVIGPVLADVRRPRPGRKAASWTRVDAGYQTVRTGIHALFDDPGISMLPAAA